jgi:hypothetical protein
MIDGEKWERSLTDGPFSNMKSEALEHRSGQFVVGTAHPTADEPACELKVVGWAVVQLVPCSDLPQTMIKADFVPYLFHTHTRHSGRIVIIGIPLCLFSKMRHRRVLQCWIPPGKASRNKSTIITRDCEPLGSAIHKAELSSAI